MENYSSVSKLCKQDNLSNTVYMILEILKEKGNNRHTRQKMAITHIVYWKNVNEPKPFRNKIFYMYYTI